MHHQIEAKEHFDKNAEKYDVWFVKHKREFEEQLEFLRPLIPKGTGIEIGVGTGRFATSLKIKYGLDNSINMLYLAKVRNIESIQGSAYLLPFKNSSFDYSLFMATLCFLTEPLVALIEAKRVSKTIISVILDKDSEYVQHIIKNKKGFYKHANFYGKKDLLDLYEKADLKVVGIQEKDLKTIEDLNYRLIALAGV